MEWKETELESLLESLIDYRGKTPQKTDRGIPLITAKIIKRGTIAEPNEYIAEENYDSWMVRGIPMAGDVVLTTEAPLGEVAQLDERKIALAQRVVCLRGKKDVLDNTYLKYYFLSAVGHKALTARETGTTVLGIKQSELRKVKVVYPPFNSQRRIASILSSLDRKIELNNKINAQLEEMAQAIFKSWFVDTKDYTLTKLEDIAIKVTDGVHNTVNNEEGSPYLLLSCKNIVGGKLSISDKERTIGKETFETLRKRTKLERLDILISTVGTVGEVVLLNDSPDFIEFQRSVGIIKTDREKASPYYVFLALKEKQKELKNSAHGAVQQCVFISDLKEFQIPLSEKSRIDKFDAVVEPIFTKIHILQKESLHLSQLRDTLLPKLMNGEIEL